MTSISRRRPSVVSVMIGFVVLSCILVLTTGACLQHTLTIQRFRDFLRRQEVPLAASLVANDWLGTRKILNSYELSDFDDVKLIKESSVVFSYPTEQLVTDCPGRETFSLQRYHAPIGEIITCSGFEKSYLYPLLSPSILALSACFVMLLSAFAFVSVLNYRNGVVQLITSFKAWSEGSIEGKLIDRVTDDDPFLDLYQIVEQRLSDRVSIEQLQAENRLSKSVADLAAQVAHDIRSPLSAINLVIKTMDQVSGDQKLLMKSAVDRINAIANDLLSRERVNFLPHTNSTATTSKPTDLEQIVRDIYREKAISAETPNVKLKLDVPSDIAAFCNIDSDGMARVISNMTNNAIEAIDEVGTVVMALRREGNFASVIISDNGKGIPDDLLKKLGHERVTFGKTTDQSGYGRGVLHAKSFVDRMNGKFSIQSQSGVGTLVTMSFPCA